MASATVRDILTFHGLDRALYDRVLGYGRNPAAARNVVGLWMWLELLGVDVIPYITDCHDHAVVMRFVEEAESILDVVRPDSPRPGEGEDAAIRFTASLVREPLSLRFFYCNSDVLVRGMARILDGVGRIVFDDHLKALLAAYRDDAKVAALEGGEVPALPPQLAQRYESLPVGSPEDCRSLFITCSQGYGLSKDDVVAYFTNKWGECIEKIVVEPTPEAVPPMYGRLVFTSESFIGLVLRGDPLALLAVNGQHLWARQYLPQNGAGF